MTLDEILAASEDLKRQQQREGIRQMNADMASEIERIKAEDWKPPFDVDAVYVPEETVPADCALQEAFAKARASQGLAEEPKETTPHYLIEDCD